MSNERYEQTVVLVWINGVLYSLCVRMKFGKQTMGDEQ